MDIRQLNLLKGRILIAPLWSDHKWGSLHLPENRRKTIPGSGIIIRYGALQEPLDVGDIVFWNADRFDVFSEPYSRFDESYFIILEDWIEAYIKEEDW